MYQVTFEGQSVLQLLAHSEAKIQASTSDIHEKFTNSNAFAMYQQASPLGAKSKLLGNSKPIKVSGIILTSAVYRNSDACRYTVRITLLVPLEFVWPLI